MDTRELSSPLVARRGCELALSASRDCTSASSGRRPSRVTVMQVPETGSLVRETNSPLGSARPTIPSSFRSKQPTSSVGP